MCNFPLNNPPTPIFMQTVAFLAHTIIVYLKVSDHKSVGECKKLIVLAQEQKVAFVFFSEFSNIIGGLLQLNESE